MGVKKVDLKRGSNAKGIKWDSLTYPPKNRHGTTLLTVIHTYQTLFRVVGFDLTTYAEYPWTVSLRLNGLIHLTIVQTPKPLFSRLLRHKWVYGGPIFSTSGPIGTFDVTRVTSPWVVYTSIACVRVFLQGKPP